jgi:hypothetical protein
MGKDTLKLLEEVLKEKSVNEVSEILNLSPGTVKRWLDLKSVPEQYIFDLHKCLSREIDYSVYSHTLKDQFFTSPELAQKCWNTFIDKTKVDVKKYQFIEPSAGDGSFMKVLPNNTIGLDIEPRCEGIVKEDYLLWKPEDVSKNHVVFGNPPFGLRGHLALRFINHSYEFADYVCFILPQLFESDGKGSPRKRVLGYNLIHSETFTENFHSPNKAKTKINCVFQIWSKHTENPDYQIKTYSDDAVRIYSMSDGGTVSSTRNKEMIGKCDIYLPSTCFGKENMKVYKSFEDLPGRRGYGIVFLKYKRNFIKKANSIDWGDISFLSTNSALNLRTSSIQEYFLG